MNADDVMKEIATHASVLGELSSSWFVRDWHVVAAYALTDVAERMARTAATLQKHLDRKEKDFASLPEWRKKVEAAELELREAKAARVGLEKRVVALEKEVADLQCACDDKDLRYRNACGEINTLTTRTFRDADRAEKLSAEKETLEKQFEQERAWRAAADKDNAHLRDVLHALMLNATQIQVILKANLGILAREGEAPEGPK